MVRFTCPKIDESQDRAWAHGVGTLYERDSTRRCFTVTGERPVRALQSASHAALRVRHAQHVSSFILRTTVEQEIEHGLQGVHLQPSPLR
jgi:hypothetical protein